MANSTLPLVVRFILDNNEQAEIVKSTMNPIFFEFQKTAITKKHEFVVVYFRCSSFDFNDYRTVSDALNINNVAFVIERALD